MKIRVKISLLTGAVFMSAVLISTLSVWTMNVTSRLRDAIDNGNRLVSTALVLHGLMKDLMVDLFTPQTYLLLKDLVHTPRSQSTRREFAASVRQFENSVADFMQSPDVRGLLRDQELRDAYDTARIMTDKATERIASIQTTVDRLFATEEGADLYRQQMDPSTGMPQFFDEVRETSYYLTYSFESFLSHFQRSLQEESALIRRQILVVFWTLTALIGAVTFTFSLVFSRRISQRIARVEEGVQAVAHGDFGARLEIRTSDEFGVLAEHFNLLIQELKRNVDSVQRLMRDVSESLAEPPGYQRILERIVDTAVRNSRADGAAVLVTDPVDGLLVASAAGRFPLAAHQPVPGTQRAAAAGDIGAGTTAAGATSAGTTGADWRAVFDQRQLVVLRGPGVVTGSADEESLLAVPLTPPQGTVGTLCLVTLAPNPGFADLDVTTLGTFAEYAALIVDNYFKYRELLDKREAEYRALQAQIQPHFLYNVLNCLVGLNRMRDPAGLERALFSLKDMLRYILDAGRWTTVAEELGFVARYCDLQRLRFPERLAMSITHDERSAGVRIPKLLLQPVVENAVIHGIEPLGRPGRLVVEARTEGVNGSSPTRITITDDGVGFLSGSGDTVERVGLANVRERLRLAYPDARMSIESSPGQGTRISIEIVDGRSGS